MATDAQIEKEAGPGNRTLRILLVGKGFPDRGGIPTFLDTLLGSALAELNDVTFLNVAHSGTPQGGQATAANLVRTARDAAAVWRAARGRDVVHIHSALVPSVTAVRAGLLAAAARSRGCAVVLHVHGGNLDLWLTNPARRLLVRLMMLPVRRVVPVWDAGEKALLRTLGRRQVTLLDNGVDVHRFGPPEDAHDPPRVLYVGLLTPRKGVLDLLEASRLLRDRGVPHRLCLLGGTPDEGPDAEDAVRAGVADQAELLGTRAPEQMPAAYAEADVFCLPSWWEAMPLSVLEAMAAGLPVVATDVGDVARAVADGTTGFVVPARSPVDLADALELLLTDPDRRNRMGIAGRSRAEDEFSAEVMVSRLSQLYADVARR